MTKKEAFWRSRASRGIMEYRQLAQNNQYLEQKNKDLTTLNNQLTSDRHDLKRELQFAKEREIAGTASSVEVQRIKEDLQAVKNALAALMKVCVLDIEHQKND